MPGGFSARSPIRWDRRRQDRSRPAHGPAALRHSPRCLEQLSEKAALRRARHLHPSASRTHFISPPLTHSAGTVRFACSHDEHAPTRRWIGGRLVRDAIAAPDGPAKQRSFYQAGSRDLPCAFPVPFRTHLFHSLAQALSRLSGGSLLVAAVWRDTSHFPVKNDSYFL